MSKIDDIASDSFIPKEETTIFQKLGSYVIEPTGIFNVVPKFRNNGEPCLNKDGEQIVENVRISYTPFIISSLGHNIDNGDKSIQIDFVDNRDRRVKEWIPTKEALSRDVMKMVGRGIVFPEKNTKAVNEYLGFYIYTKAKDLVEQKITNKNGWKNNQSLFVIGEQSYSEEGNNPIINNGDRYITAALKPHGTIEDWVKSVLPLLKFMNVRFKCYGAMTAPILRVLNQQSFIIHNYDDSSVGKSTISNIAMSHIGNPKTLEYSANSTQNGAEKLAELFTDLPLNLDETSAAKAETLKIIVYMISNERGRSRATRESALRESSTWKTVCLTTGEAPITSDSTFTGAKIRVIEIFGGIGAHVPEAVELSKGIYQSYGHIMPLYLKKLFEHKNEIQKKYLEYKEVFQKEIESSSGMDTRLIDTFAAITTAGYLLELVYNDIGIKNKEPIEVTKQILKNTIDRRRNDKYGARALEAVGSWIESNNKFFITERGKINEKKEETLDGTTDDDKRFVIYGWIAHIQDHSEKTNIFVDILPHHLKKFLSDSGYNPERCLEEWKEQNIIVCKDGRYTTTQRHSFDIKRVIRFKSEAILSLNGGEI